MDQVNKETNPISRREVIRLAWLTLLAGVLAACNRGQVDTNLSKPPRSPQGGQEVDETEIRPTTENQNGYTDLIVSGTEGKDIWAYELDGSASLIDIITESARYSEWVGGITATVVYPDRGRAMHFSGRGEKALMAYSGMAESGALAVLGGEVYDKYDPRYIPGGSGLIVGIGQVEEENFRRITQAEAGLLAPMDECLKVNYSGGVNKEPEVIMISRMIRDRSRGPAVFQHDPVVTMQRVWDSDGLGSYASSEWELIESVSNGDN